VCIYIAENLILNFVKKLILKKQNGLFRAFYGLRNSL